MLQSDVMRMNRVYFWFFLHMDNYNQKQSLSNFEANHFRLVSTELAIHSFHFHLLRWNFMSTAILIAELKIAKTHVRFYNFL